MQPVDPYHPPAASLEAPQRNVAEAGQLFAVFRLAWSRMSAGVLAPVGILVALQFALVTVPMALMQYFTVQRSSQWLSSGLDGMWAGLLGWGAVYGVSMAIVFTISTVFFGLSLPLRNLMVHGLAARVTVGQSFHLAISNFWHVLATTLTVGLITTVGTLFCLLPGLVAMFFFMPAPYLAAQGATTGQALTLAPAMARRNWGPLLAVILVSCAVLLPTGAAAAVGQIALTHQVGEAWGTLISQLASGILSAVASVPMWLLVIAALVYVETTERGVPLAWTEPAEQAPATPPSPPTP
jgi:hypothetical protein